MQSRSNCYNNKIRKRKVEIDGEREEDALDKNITERRIRKKVIVG